MSDRTRALLLIVFVKTSSDILEKFKHRLVCACACVVKSFTNSNNDREPLHEDMSEFSNTKERRVLFSKHAGMLHMPRLLVSVYVGQ